MSLQPRSKFAAPVSVKAVKPHRKGTAGKATSSASPRKREKTNARSIERAKRFADSRLAGERPDSRPTTRRDASLAQARSGDGRPNYEPKKRTKFIPGGKRTGTTTRSSHSGIATPHKNSFPRPKTQSRTTNNFSNNHYSEDFGADDNYLIDVEQESAVEASHHTPNETTSATFADLGIAPVLVQLLTSQGINSPFPIQVATLPDAIKGHDILGRGQTGSGKTLAFALALLTRLEGKQAAPHRPLALILTPTRELALQINDVISPLARTIRLDSVVIAGGMPYAKQITAMRKSCPILVATPGRLIDLLNRGEVQLDDLQITVLDEADQMADMGFLPVVKEILDQGKPNGQRLLFSATLDRGVDSLVKKYLNNPKTHSLQSDRASVSTMEHHVLVMHPSDKDEITAQIASRDGRTILFVKTQRGADRLADKLASVGVAVGALHGGKSQAVRTRTLAHFKSNPTAALVATDVAARGIHVDDVSLVVHVDAPTDHKDYLHRAGRTARAGEAGVVVTLATSKQQTAVRGLTSRAGVYPKFVDVRPNHAELVLITGSKEPSGIAYIAPVAAKSDFGGVRRGKPRPNSDQRRRRPR
jgi:superfamily II DNA/RNA helicase